MSKSSKTKGKIVSKKGFTLMEVLVAMFIFALMISASMVSLAKVFDAYRRAKGVQEDLDNAQYAINLMTKSLRTSSVKSESEDNVVVFDYSRGECVEYEFGGDSLRTRSVIADFDSCDSGKVGGESFVSMTSGKVDGKFWATESDSSNVGKVTVLLQINPNEKNEVNIQSTVSLRDYGVSGIQMGL